MSEPVARAHVGVATKKAKKNPTAEHRAAVVEARRQHAEAALAEHIRRVVNAAPELTDEQKSRLALLFRPSGS